MILLSDPYGDAVLSLSSSGSRWMALQTTHVTSNYRMSMIPCPQLGLVKKALLSVFTEHEPYN